VVRFVAGSIIAGALEFRSIDSFNAAIDEATKRPSVSAAFEVLEDTSPSLFEGPEVLFASGLGIVLTPIATPLA